MTEASPSDNHSRALDTTASIAYLCGFFPMFTACVLGLFQIPPVKRYVVWIVTGMANALTAANVEFFGWIFMMMLSIPILVAIPFVTGMVGGTLAVRGYRRGSTLVTNSM